MTGQKKTDQKTEVLRQQGCLNPRAKQISDPRFLEDEFFDARDLVQAKYEMLRRVRTEGTSVTDATEAFGVSRPVYYQALDNFETGGLVGLVPKKRGPRGRHKLTDEVLEFVEEELRSAGRLPSIELVVRVEKRFGVQVHPRSLERALAEKKKRQ